MGQWKTGSGNLGTDLFPWGVGIFSIEQSIELNVYNLLF